MLVAAKDDQIEASQGAVLRLRLGDDTRRTAAQGNSRRRVL